jgi:hypothetical protein
MRIESGVPPPSPQEETKIHMDTYLMQKSDLWVSDKDDGALNPNKKILPKSANGLNWYWMEFPLREK